MAAADRGDPIAGRSNGVCNLRGGTMMVITRTSILLLPDCIMMAGKKLSLSLIVARLSSYVLSRDSAHMAQLLSIQQ